jgi:hypothetical protein
MVYLGCPPNKDVGNEVPLMQCNTCGSEVPPDQISKGDPLYEIKIFVLGLICGGLLRMLFTWLQIG